MTNLQKIDSYIGLIGIPLVTLAFSLSNVAYSVPSVIVIVLLVVHLAAMGFTISHTKKPTSPWHYLLIILAWLLQAFMTVSFLQITEWFYVAPIIVLPFMGLFGYILYGLHMGKSRPIPTAVPVTLIVTSFSLMILINMYSPANMWLPARQQILTSFLALGMIIGLRSHEIFKDQGAFTDKKSMARYAIGWIATWMILFFL